MKISDCLKAMLTGYNGAAMPYIFCVLAAVAGVAAITPRFKTKLSFYCISFALYTLFLALCAKHFGNAEIFHVAQLLCYAVFLGGPLLLLIYAIHARDTFKIFSSFCAISAILLLLTAIDAFLVEPHWLQVTHYKIVNSKIKEPTRLAVVADIQTDRVGEYEMQALQKVIDQKPDVLLLAGDYIQTFTGEDFAREGANLKQLFLNERVIPRLGAWAVRGNVDWDDWINADFKGTKVNCFESTTSVKVGSMTLTALSCNDSFDLKSKIPVTSDYHIIMGHSPNFMQNDAQGDLFIAGHTHGGQIQLPFFGPLVTLSAVPRSWAKGAMISLPGERTCIISRGVGMERNHAPRLRFFCRPELVIIDLLPAQNAVQKDP